MQRSSTKKKGKSSATNNNDSDGDPNQKCRRKVGKMAKKVQTQHLYKGCGFFFLLMIIPLVFMYMDIQAPWANEQYTIHVAEKNTLGVEAAKYLIDASKTAISDRDKFGVALSGGSMPKLLKAGIKEVPGLQASTDWSKWNVVWADERCVDFDSDDSTFKAWKSFFSEVGIPSEQIYNIDTTLLDEPDAAAADYQERLEKLLGELTLPDGELRTDDVYTQPIDVVMLGMGVDGHTASLFPSHALLRENVLKVASLVDSPKPPDSRITLTLPVINKARSVAFLVTGAGKAPAVATIMGIEEKAKAMIHLSSIRPMGRHSTGTVVAEYMQYFFGLHTKHVASLVKPTQGKLKWFLDIDAAAQLPQ